MHRPVLNQVRIALARRGGLLSLELASGMLDFTLVEQLAWDELCGDAEETSEESANGRQPAGELGIVGCVRIFDGGVDDGARTRTHPDSDKSSGDHRPRCIAGSDKLNLVLRQRD